MLVNPVPTMRRGSQKAKAEYTFIMKKRSQRWDMPKSIIKGVTYEAKCGKQMTSTKS